MDYRFGWSCCNGDFNSCLHACYEKNRNSDPYIPFIIVTWFTLLVSYRLKAFHLSTSLVPQDLANWTLNIAGATIGWKERLLALGKSFS